MKCISERTNNDNGYLEDDQSNQDDESDNEDDPDQDDNNPDQGAYISFFAYWTKLCFSLNSKEKESLSKEEARRL